MVGEKFAALTPEQFMVELEKVVAERGLDYQYNTSKGGCSYGETDINDSCVIGRIMQMVDPELYEEAARAEVEEGGSWPISQLYDTLGIVSGFDGYPYVKVEDLATVAQTLQDRGWRYEAVLTATQKLYRGELDKDRLIYGTRAEVVEMLGVEIFPANED